MILRCNFIFMDMIIILPCPAFIFYDDIIIVHCLYTIFLHKTRVYGIYQTFNTAVVTLGFSKLSKENPSK
ncbi:hypothetical protein AM493_05710 [Flavobacterium akiainvivens]|uniref:Uncharacterized protein n=1 Tax=Flavobacterium akiainvivens TaxID=1202724 RepID=A0A0M8MC02_9FLAO|nr:hypothetical protein AM493_05710 [Flavobacterium akiainvivens]